MKRMYWSVIFIATAVGCNKPAEQAAEFEAIPVERRDILLRVSAAGAIQPVLAVDVKSKASGEIMSMTVQSGQDVRQGTLLAEVDPRLPRSAVDQAVAELNMAQASSENAKVQLTRADTLFKMEAITQTEFEAARLADAAATAGVVRARADLQVARDALADTRLVAPISGTIIEKYVELGTVISSPSKDVGGGTVIYTMANLDTVQLQAMVDETDIGRVHPGIPVGITVDAYPRHPFEGKVLKIEPKAEVRQNVTMFPVLVNIANPGHLLKPGMNAEIEINVGERHNVLAIPNAALRSEADIGAAANWLGLDKRVLRRRLARTDPTRIATTSDGDARAEPAADPPPAPTPKSPPDTAGAEMRVTFVLRNDRPVPVHVLVGLTDLDYTEVLRGLSERDTVLILPTSGLVNDLDKQQKKAQVRAGGGLPGVRQQ